MALTIYELKTCSTCRKAIGWLKEHNIEHTAVPIRDAPPTLEQLTEAFTRSGLPLARFFNTSGKSYRSGGWSARRKQSTQEQQLQALAADPMLLKRPLVVSDKGVLVGFKQEEWRQLLG